MDPFYTIKRLAVVQVFLVAFYLFAGCGLQQASKQVFEVTDLLTTFPAYFSLQAALHFTDLHHTFRFRLACSVTFDQQIDFIIKGPLGIAIISGRIDKKGVTVVDRLRRVVHQWDYNHIQHHYHFLCNYPVIQSLLLGRVYDPIEDRPSDGLSSVLTYTYDGPSRKVVAVQCTLPKQGNLFKLLYRHKIVGDRSGLSGIKLHFSLRDIGKLYQGRATLYKFRFKKLKRPNIKLVIPAYYRK